MAATRDIFDKCGYVLLQCILSREIVAALHAYALRVASDEQAAPDVQVPGTPAVYSDPVMEHVLMELLPWLEELLCRQLHPTYSYFRVYQRGAVLHRHKDRPACEISLSLSLGYDGAGVWPLNIEGPEGIYAAELQPGDGLLYKGVECYHWREPFLGVSCAQVFLHYVDRNGPNAEWRLDKRPNSGNPPSSPLSI